MAPPVCTLPLGPQLDGVGHRPSGPTERRDGAPSPSDDAVSGSILRDVLPHPGAQDPRFEVIGGRLRRRDPEQGRPAHAAGFRLLPRVCGTFTAMTRVILTGVSGWAGSALARGIVAAPDLDLVAGVARGAAGATVGEVLPGTESDAPILATIEEALKIPADVVVEYAKGDGTWARARAAVDAGLPLVVGASGLDDEAYTDLDARARERGIGVLAVGNFSWLAMLLERFAVDAAAYAEAIEVIDYAGAAKPDAPSGTAREVAALLSGRTPPPKVPPTETAGEVAARGATLAGTQVHSLRVPGHVLSTEVVVGLSDQRLTIRHDAGAGADAYVPGALLAIRRVGSLTGLHRGLGSVVDVPVS